MLSPVPLTTATSCRNLRISGLRCASSVCREGEMAPGGALKRMRSPVTESLTSICRRHDRSSAVVICVFIENRYRRGKGSGFATRAKRRFKSLQKRALLKMCDGILPGLFAHLLSFRRIAGQLQDLPRELLHVARLTNQPAGVVDRAGQLCPRRCS